MDVIMDVIEESSATFPFESNRIEILNVEIVAQFTYEHPNTDYRPFVRTYFPKITGQR